MDPSDLDLPDLEPITVPGGDAPLNEPVDGDPGRPEIEGPAGFPDLGGLPEGYERPEPVAPPAADTPDTAVDLSLPAAAPTPVPDEDGNGLFDSPFGFAIIPVTFALGRVSRALRTRS